MRRHLSLLVLARALLLFPLLSLQADAEVSVTPGTFVREDAGPVDLCVESSPAVEEDITVDYAIIDGTAVQGEDFAVLDSATGTITVPANETMACLMDAVTYIADILYETNQSYMFEISGPNVTDELSSTEYVIEDTTPVPDITFSQITYTFTEGDNNGTEVVMVTTGNVSVQSPAVVTGVVIASPDTAQANDFFLPVSEVAITDGDSSSFEIVIVGDDVYEGDEQFILTIGSETATVVIQDDESPPIVTVDAPMAIFKPDRMADLCAEISVVSEPEIVVGYTVTGNEAELEKDFTVPNGSDGYIVIEPGMMKGCIVLMLFDDSVFEANETVTFSLTNSSHGILGDPSSLTIHIVDNEDSPRLFVTSPSEVDINENSTEGVVICVNVTVSSAFGISVSYQVTDVTTNATEDYYVSEGVSGTLNFQPLQEQDCVTINIVDDIVYEGNEQLTFQLSNPENATLAGPSEVTITIIDNDYPVLSVEPLPAPVEEYVGNISVCINASVPSRFTNRISFSVGDVNATLHEDYVVFPNATGDLTLMPFDTSDCVTISIEDDNVYEGTEQFTFMLSDATRASLSNESSSITITIIDDESPPVFTLLAPSMVDESEGNFSICVNFSVQSSFEILVPCQINDITTSPADYTVFTTTNNDGFLFEPVWTIQCLTVGVVDDTEFEGDEVVSFELINPTFTNAELGDPSAVNITIVDNDPSPVPSPSSSPSQSTTEPTQEDDDTLLYIIVGAVGGAVLAALVFLLLIILIIACCRVKVNRQGFYVTDEDKGDAPQMLRYSASLRSISSQTVVPVDTRDKENEYMV